MPRFADKLAVVTGGGAGIGLAAVSAFAREGAAVVALDIDAGSEPDVRQALGDAGARGEFLQADVADEAQVAAAFRAIGERFGRLDVLVNSAATFSLSGLQVDPSDWQRSFAVNVTGTALCCREAARAMAGRGGAIVNLASISALVAQPAFLPYSATKAAVVQLTRNLAVDLAPAVRVNCVCPGTILTGATRRRFALASSPTGAHEGEECQRHLLGRLGTPDEVARAILFLASDEASFITGTSLVVDGGYTVI